MARARPVNVHSAEGWEELLSPEIERQQELRKEVAFRADAAFAKPEIYEALESQGAKYAISIPANENLERSGRKLINREKIVRPSFTHIVAAVAGKGFLGPTKFKSRQALMIVNSPQRKNLSTW